MKKIKNNIILIGFMGAGKTTIGKLLAKYLHRKFIDTDNLIEKFAGKSVSRIFNEDGEKKFRSLEKKMISKIVQKDNLVIAVGGGAVTKPKNLSKLKKNGTLVYLYAIAKEILKRIYNKHHRPLMEIAISKKEKLIRIKDLLAIRKTYYEKADYTLNTSNLNTYQVAKKIIKLLKLS
ncbi:MAG: shikimate kinase [Candidatus Firestonebacteria bacterium]